MERLKKIGSVKSVSASDVKLSRLGIGFEKLDREAFDPEKAYDKVAAIGIKWARIQSGWERTEQQKGVYDFSWLDVIVDNLLKRDLVPWLNVSYGNPLYTEKAKEVFGSVGCPPVETPEEMQAWLNYVKALVKHFAGRIEYYEIWNEPDGKSCWKIPHSGKVYGEMVIASALAAREVYPEAKIIGGVMNKTDFPWMTDFFATGVGSYIDAFSYHNYSSDEFNRTEFVKSVRTIGRAQNPALELIQGEGGTHSRSGGKGALKNGPWNPLRQAKYMMRHFMADFQLDVKFSSWFSSIDMMEALNGVRGQLGTWQDYGYFGVIQAEFDELGRATGSFTEKPSYRTLQVLASVFREEFDITELPVMPFVQPSLRVGSDDTRTADFASTGFRRPDGSAAYAYWKRCNLLTESYDGTVSFHVAGTEKPRLIDLLDGSIYELPDEMVTVNGTSLTLNNLPLYDYPLLLVFGGFCD